VNPADLRVLAIALGGLIPVGVVVNLAALPFALSVGLYLLTVAGWLFVRLHAQGGWASGSLGAYVFAVVSLGLQLTLPFLDWFDRWLAGLAGFGATVGLVTVACLPHLDRTRVPDPTEDLPADGQPLRIEGRPLDRAGRRLLLVYSQVVVAANGLVTWHTFHAH
jgi:hypothetical protein